MANPGLYYPPPQPAQARTLLVQPGPAADSPPGPGPVGSIVAHLYAVWIPDPLPVLLHRPLAIQGAIAALELFTLDWTVTASHLADSQLLILQWDVSRKIDGTSPPDPLLLLSWDILRAEPVFRLGWDVISLGLADGQAGNIQQPVIIATIHRVEA